MVGDEVDYVIVGGGVAGLSAANRLLELGLEPLLIEGGSYPSHKVCGEFFSPISLPLLKKWDIFPIPLSQLRLHTASRSLSFVFPQPAGALSHLQVDPTLAQQLLARGVTLLTKTTVVSWHPPASSQERHQLTLSSGEKVLAKHLFMATGRIPHPSFSAPPILYKGFKAHFSGIKLNSTLEMFSFPGAYLGLAPIEEGKVNVACLATLEAVGDASPSDFMHRLIERHPLLRGLIQEGGHLFPEWMSASIPSFGLRPTPPWPRTYFIGDAAGTIPPACGKGLSLALASGCLAAEYGQRDDAAGFKRAWHRQCRLQMTMANMLHRLLLAPHWGDRLLQLGEKLPWLANKTFTLAR